jgi:hypothetical protein
MSTTPKSPGGLKNTECKKGQLSNRLPIPYIAEADTVTPKEDPQVLKAKLPDNSHINMHIYSRGNTKEYFTHIVAVLPIIKKNGLDVKCRKLKKAVLRQFKMLKNLLEATELRDTVLMDIVVQARKVEIEQIQQLLQEFQKAHDKAIAKVYEQLRNLLSGNAQFRWDRTTLKSPGGLKNTECKKGQLSNQGPIPYVTEADTVTPKEDPQVLKAKLPDDSHINMHIYSHGNTKEYFTHIVAALPIIKQKGLDVRCRKLKKAVLRQFKMLKNLLEAAGLRDTVLMDIDVQARKVEIEQIQQLLQEFQKAHDEAIAKVYEQLRNLLSGNAKCQWDRVCRELHKRDLWAGVNSQVTEGRHLGIWMSFQDCLELHKLTVFHADAAKRQQFYIQQASPRGPQ